MLVNDCFHSFQQEKGEADSSGAGGGGGGGGGASAALGGPASNGLSAASKTLTDSARELEEARAAKRKYDEVAVVTGEEDELNVLQIYGKLFTFDKVQGKPYILLQIARHLTMASKNTFQTVQNWSHRGRRF